MLPNLEDIVSTKEPISSPLHPQKELAESEVLNDILWRRQFAFSSIIFMFCGCQLDQASLYR